MRYVIIGAGAIGGALGARLAQHSHEHPPLLIARGEHGAAIARDGLRLRTPDEDVLLPVDVAANPHEVELRADDVLVLATKTHQAEAAVREWVDRPVAGGSTAGESLPILTALNGVESERIALRHFARVFGVCVWLPAVHLIPGEVIIRIAPVSGLFIVGRYGGGADAADQHLLATVAADWTASSYLVHPVDDVMRWKYSKLLSNLGNAVQALVGSDPAARGITERLRAEAEEEYLAAGISWAPDAEEAELRGDHFRTRAVPGVDDELGGSSWQSLKRGSGSIETDFLNGEIALLARSRGRRAPLNEATQRIARQAAASKASPGSTTAHEFARLLGVEL